MKRVVELLVNEIDRLEFEVRRLESECDDLNRERDTLRNDLSFAARGVSLAKEKYGQTLTFEELRDLRSMTVEDMRKEKIKAIKLVRTATKVGLKEAKDFVEELIEEGEEE